MSPRSRAVTLAVMFVASALAGACTKKASETPPQPPEGQVCTRDAKVCPDGSAVGRTGPNCEFAPCPAGAPEPPIE